MRSPLKKLLAVVVPVFVSLAISAGTASADTLVEVHTCPKSNMELSPVFTTHGHHDSDANGNGYVCVKTNGNSLGGAKDDTVAWALVP